MREISSSIWFEVGNGETVPLRVTDSTQLTVHGGAVWVTRSDDVEDYWLEPGKTLRLRRGERLWLSAEGKTHACVEFFVPKRAGERAINWFARVAERFGARMRGGWLTV
ncbi:DUF2917 domain-containing protein [Paraburkholderia sp. SARCC-3016]|uniref:DUF2917 domain-containing protein n=1 Tax=Paraburkholderia sp. SARCC-3016 TaxID=3058611 RepID=UPI002808346F|nr:DUF2917 domain-containing protein [Paraburkholderia sp. SARCC-3016]MDQ7980243.1 DUF2917 domain-containing protein [Paraburkholderia sp. SARCC-3016]